MKTFHDYKTTSNNLSNCNNKFLEFVEQNPGALDLSNFGLLELNDELFKLQPWPTFINRSTRKEIKEASEKVFELIKAIPGRFFDNDVEKICNYYGYSESMVKNILDSTNEYHNKNILARGDFILTASGWKSIEYNVTANLGGWQVPLWESLYLNTPLISDFFAKYKVKPENENLLYKLLNLIVKNVTEQQSVENELNIALTLESYSPEEEGELYGIFEDYLNDLLRRTLVVAGGNMKGRFIFCDYSQLEIKDKRLFYDNNQIHAVMEMLHGSIPQEILDVFKAGNLCLYNGPLTVLLSSKLNLALLSENQDSDVFTTEERTAIKKYIPWTRKVIPGRTVYEDKEIDLETFIRSNKEKLVLKPSNEYGGTGVCIGCKCDPAEWENTLAQALEEKNWLVQEYWESLKYIYQAGEKGYEVHDVAWGFFLLGTQYAGAWARVMPAEGKAGVINCHQGAKVSIIFDVEE